MSWFSGAKEEPSPQENRVNLDTNPSRLAYGRAFVGDEKAVWSSLCALERREGVR